MNGTLFKSGQVARTPQSSVTRQQDMTGKDIVQSSFAQVLAVYPQTMTCDILNSNGLKKYNVPILTKCGLDSDEKVWGEVELPSVKQYVLVEFVGGRESFPIIVGTLYPYSNSKYQGSQETVNSSDKSFTKKLLEKISEKVFRKVFKSGTSIEVKEDGTLIVETPSGSTVQIDDANKKIIIEQKDGSNKCTLTFGSSSGFDLKDKDNNEVISSSSGMQLKDKNGNVIDMGTTSVKINNNLEVLQ